MLTRRSLLLLSAATVLLARLPAHAQTPGGGDSQFVQSFGSQLVSVVNGDEDAAAKASKLRPLIDSAVDVDAIARFCLGRFVNSATPQQLTEYTRLFHAVLLNNILSKIGEYRGVSFELAGSESKRGDDTIVSSIVQRPNNAPNNVRWVVSNNGGKPRIVDVVAEGTSLRLTQRSDYAAYMSQHNYDLNSLISAMRNQINAG